MCYIKKAWSFEGYYTWDHDIIKEHVPLYQPSHNWIPCKNRVIKIDFVRSSMPSKYFNDVLEAISNTKDLFVKLGTSLHPNIELNPNC